jgi:hypothetical protein
MNLFRSEETVTGWSQTAPGSEKDGTLPVRTWAGMFSANLFRKRLAPDYLSKVPEYLGEMLGLMEELGMVGPFFFTQR